MFTNFIIAADLPQPNQKNVVHTCCSYMGELLLYLNYIVTPKS